MYKQLKNGILTLGSMYFLACGSPQQRINNPDDVEETVHRTHTEETTVTTRTENENEHTTSITNGNTTTTDRRLTRHSNENRLRTIDTDEGNFSANSRNLNLDLEGLVSGIQHGIVSKSKDNDNNVFFTIRFSYNGNNFHAELIDFADDMIGELGNHICDYFDLALERGRNFKYFLRVNFSDNEGGVNDFRQDPHTASVQHYVPVGNVVYNIDMEGGHGQDGSFTNEDIMRLVDTARSHVGPEYQ